jgi:hypothetical protein
MNEKKETKNVFFSETYQVTTGIYTIQYNVRSVNIEINETFGRGLKTSSRRLNLLALNYNGSAILKHTIELHMYNSILQAFTRGLLTKKPYHVNDSMHIQRTNIANEEMLEVFVNKKTNHYITKPEAIFLNSIFSNFLRRAHLFEE